MSMPLASLRSHLRWLRTAAHHERLWIAGLTRNGAGPELLAEHHAALARRERSIARIETRLAEPQRKDVA